MSTLSSNGKQALDDFVKKTLESQSTAGFVLGVSNIDKEIYFNGGGHNVVNDPTSGEVNPDSVFWICSQTKMIAALAVLKLIEQRRLSMDDPVGSYIPEFRNPIVVERTSTQKTAFRPAQTVVTIRHLLNYTSGLFYPVVRDNLTGLNEGYFSKEMHTSDDPRRSFFRIVIGELPALPLKFEPGTDFVYGWSSDALGFVVEAVSGQSLEVFCKQHIFEPLGMQTTSFYLTPELRQRAVNLAFREKDGGLSPWNDQVDIIEQDPTKLRLHLGGVGMYSSMRDYLKLLRHLLQIEAGRPTDIQTPILTQETVRGIFTPVLPEKGSKSLSDFVTVPGSQWGTAMAIATTDWPKRRRAGSAFWGGWAGTSHVIDPKSGIALVFGIQTAPSPDIPSQKLWSRLEALVYEALIPETGKSRI